MDDGKKFIVNFRNARNNPFASSSPASLITRGDIVKRNRAERKAERAARAEMERYWQDEVGSAIEATAPLREAIRQASGGKVLVDNTIYDETELNRILNSIKEMREMTNGSLMPGYTVISDRRALSTPNTLGEMYYNGRNAYGDVRLGTKNLPYRIYIRDANDTEINDWIFGKSIDSGYHPKTGDKEESAVQTHELSHSAQHDASKKINNPALTLNYAEKLARQAFRKDNKSLQEIFDVAAKNTGFDSVWEAAKSISGYAMNDAYDEAEYSVRPKNDKWSPYVRLAEVFAEAYTDVLYNKDKAKPYSKELISLYSDYAKNYNKEFGNAMPRQDKGLMNLPRTDNQSEFMKNLREMYFGEKK